MGLHSMSGLRGAWRVGVVAALSGVRRARPPGGAARRGPRAGELVDAGSESPPDGPAPLPDAAPPPAVIPGSEAARSRS